MRTDLWTARLEAGLSIDQVANHTGCHPSIIQGWEHYRGDMPLHIGDKLATMYRKTIDEIAWDREQSDIEIASKYMRVSPKTMRAMIRQGRYGEAVKGEGDKWIYIVNWNEVENGLGYARP